MKIVFGVCSLGQGHINRQKLIIRNFLKKNCQVVIVTSPGNEYFNDEFPNIPVIYCSVPWISTNNRGLDFSDCLKKHQENRKDYFEEFLTMSMEIEKKLNGLPDIVISDYEPNVAQYAYARDIKLVNLEQQSKFLYLNNQKVNDISLLEEQSRIKYFFPKSDLRIISSFFNINYNGTDPVYVIPPIIEKKENHNCIENNLVIVYFSTYGNGNYKELFIKILNMIKDKKDLVFKVYTSLEFPEYKNYKHIKFCDFSEEFKQDFKKCKFVISTSGHQLISECIYYNKPLFLTSFNTFEQNYNLKMIEEFSLGYRIKDYNLTELDNFIDNIDIYLLNIEKYKKDNINCDWEELFDKYISQLLEVNNE